MSGVRGLCTRGTAIVHAGLAGTLGRCLLVKPIPYLPQRTSENMKEQILLAAKEQYLLPSSSWKPQLCSVACVCVCVCVCIRACACVGEYLYNIMHDIVCMYVCVHAS